MTLGCGELNLMGSFLPNLLTTLLKLSSLLKSNVWVSISFGILKSLLKPYHLLGDCFGIGFLLRITYLGDKLRLTMISAPSVKANLRLPLICSSHVVKFCLCGGNSIHGLRKIEFSTIARWITFYSTQLQQEGRTSIEDGRYGGWLLQSQFGNSGMTWCFIIILSISLSWRTIQFSSLGLGSRGGKRISMFLFTNGP